MSLAEKLKKCRSDTGQSLQDVANGVGTSKTHIWKLEKGVSGNPSLRLLISLAAHFNVPTTYLTEQQATSGKLQISDFIARNAFKFDRLTERDIHLLDTMIDNMQP